MLEAFGRSAYKGLGDREYDGDVSPSRRMEGIDESSPYLSYQLMRRSKDGGQKMGLGD